MATCPKCTQEIKYLNSTYSWPEDEFQEFWAEDSGFVGCYISRTWKVIFRCPFCKEILFSGMRDQYGSWDEVENAIEMAKEFLKNDIIPASFVCPLHIKKPKPR